MPTKITAQGLIFILGALMLTGCWHARWFSGDERGTNYQDDRYDNDYGHSEDYRGWQPNTNTDYRRGEETREIRDHWDQD